MYTLEINCELIFHFFEHDFQVTKNNFFIKINSLRSLICNWKSNFIRVTDASFRTGIWARAAFHLKKQNSLHKYKLLSETNFHKLSRSFPVFVRFKFKDNCVKSRKEILKRRGNKCSNNAKCRADGRRNSKLLETNVRSHETTRFLSSITSEKIFLKYFCKRFFILR